jgi:hypothetical protein
MGAIFNSTAEAGAVLDQPLDLGALAAVADVRICCRLSKTERVVTLFRIRS